MPQLALRFRGTETMGLKIKWKLKVEHKRRNGRVVTEDTVNLPWVEEALDGTVELFANTDWISQLQQKGFFGGEAELTYQLLKSDGAALSTETKMLFSIGGKNPDDDKCKSFITQAANQTQPPMAWFAYAIAKHESKDYNGSGSRFNQFWEKSGRFGGVDYNEGEVLWVNNPGEEPPKGFGLFQVTGNVLKKNADIPRQQLWNWQENVRGGLAIVASKRGIADRYFARIKRTSPQHKTAFDACLPPMIGVGTHSFSSADAIQVYCYNGTGAISGRTALIWDRYPFDPAKACGLGATKRWFWNPHNVAGGEPYIKKVEREL